HRAETGPSASHALWLNKDRRQSHDGRESRLTHARWIGRSVNASPARTDVKNNSFILTFSPREKGSPLVISLAWERRTCNASEGREEGWGEGNWILEIASCLPRADRRRRTLPR